MQDVLYLGIIAGFFAVCVGFVKVCERIVGPDVELGDEVNDQQPLAGAVAEERVA